MFGVSFNNRYIKCGETFGCTGSRRYCADIDIVQEWSTEANEKETDDTGCSLAEALKWQDQQVGTRNFKNQASTGA